MPRRRVQGFTVVKLFLSRLLSWVMLAVYIVGVYVVIVGLASMFTTASRWWASVAGAVLIALTFEPVSNRVRRWCNRLVLGDRASPYEVLSDLSQTMARAESVEGLLDQSAERLADGTRADRAAIWVAQGDGFSPVGRWPKDAELARASAWEELPGHITPIDSEAGRLGAMTVERLRSEPITANEDELLGDLAGSTASVLRNLALQSELRATADELEVSRKRMMEAQNLERRRMERQLDEGAQQLVVSLKVKLNVAARLARADGAEPLAEMLETMDAEARAAIDQIRSLAKGLYPPLLEAEGLVAAVRALADKAGAPVVVEVGDLERLPLDLEATVFFCISEAVTNAAKHAQGQTIVVGITRVGERLEFEVEDHGPGFDRASTKLGSGLQNMADRIDAAGGGLQVVSAPGAGTRVLGWVPLEPVGPSELTLLQPAFH
jgi:signal transduction histidine kinase